MLKGVPFHYRAAMKQTSHLTGKQLRVPLAERIQTSHIRSMAYSKKIELAVFDWAGTTINPYSTAPLAAMVETFAQYGMNTDESGRYSAMYKPFHLIGLELNVSVLSAAILGKATGYPSASLSG